jgi:hypothetical protein
MMLGLLETTGLEREVEVLARADLKPRFFFLEPAGDKEGEVSPALKLALSLPSLRSSFNMVMMME